MMLLKKKMAHGKFNSSEKIVGSAMDDWQQTFLSSFIKYMNCTSHRNLFRSGTSMP